MIRRRCTTWVLVAVAAAALAGRVRASSLASYEIVSTKPAGSAPVTEIDALIRPPGSIYAPTSSTSSPMTVLAGSSGFNANDLTFKLGNNQSGQNVALGFVFDPTTGFAPGGVLNFSLQTTGPAPTITLIDPKTGQPLPPGSGLSIATFTPPTTGTGTGSSSKPTDVPGGSPPPHVQVPEPVSLALWSVAAGFGLLRARAFRRARQVAF